MAVCGGNNIIISPRDKLLLPTIGSLPLLMVYYVTYGNTYIVLPHPLDTLIGASAIDLGKLAPEGPGSI